MTDERVRLLNRVANRPDILAAVAPGFKHIDLAPFFNHPKNVMLGNSRGVLLFAWKGNGVYEMHYLFTGIMRGRDALRATKMALRAMFTKHCATAICGATPRENRAARAMNRALGARPTGVSTDSLGRACIDYILERDTWAALSAESSEA